MNKQEFIKKIQELREDGEHDLRTVIYFAEQLDEPSREECEMIPHNVATKKGMVLHGRKCTNCEKWFRGCSIIHKSDKANYCPNCGAKIKREKKDERN